MAKSGPHGFATPAGLSFRRVPALVLSRVCRSQECAGYEGELP